VIVRADRSLGIKGLGRLLCKTGRSIGRSELGRLCDLSDAREGRLMGMLLGRLGRFMGKLDMGGSEGRVAMYRLALGKLAVERGGRRLPLCKSARPAHEVEAKGAERGYPDRRTVHRVAASATPSTRMATTSD
jgi:hypothetical protein